MDPANAPRKSKSMATPLQNATRVNAAGQHRLPGSLAIPAAALLEATGADLA